MGLFLYVFPPNLKTVYSLCVQCVLGCGRATEPDMASEDTFGSLSSPSSVCVLKLGRKHPYQLSHPPSLRDFLL